MDILVGYTGFVGQNLNRKHNFTATFNSKNIKDAYGTSPDLCVYSGIRSEKFRADNFPDEDLAHIKDAIQNIKQISPKQLVLISTVDVIPSGQEKDIYEDTEYNMDKLTPYGENRLLLEREIRELYPNVLIIRLPALFGYGLKKNFIFDLINYIPAMLKESKFKELVAKEQQLKRFYFEDSNGFFRVTSDLSPQDKETLKKMFKELGFSALNFTDSRSKFAFYNLNYLWEHIEILLNENVSLAHMACEPVSASELYQELYGINFVNEITNQPFDYTFFKTKYAQLLGGNQGYIFNKELIITEVKNFVETKEVKNEHG